MRDRGAAMKAFVALFLSIAYLSGCAKVSSNQPKDHLDSERSVANSTRVAKSPAPNNHPYPPLDTDSNRTFERADSDFEGSSSPQKLDNNQFIQQPIEAGRDRSSTKKEILARIAPRLSRSTADLPVTYGADGHVRIGLKGRFSHVSLAKRMPDGTIRYTCVDNIKSAKAWFSSSERPKEQ